MDPHTRHLEFQGEAPVLNGLIGSNFALPSTSRTFLSEVEDLEQFFICSSLNGHESRIVSGDFVAHC